MSRGDSYARGRIVRMNGEQTIVLRGSDCLSSTLPMRVDAWLAYEQCESFRNEIEKRPKPRATLITSPQRFASLM